MAPAGWQVNSQAVKSAQKEQQVEQQSGPMTPCQAAGCLQERVPAKNPSRSPVPGSCNDPPLLQFCAARKALCTPLDGILAQNEALAVGLPCILGQYRLHQAVGVTAVVEEASHIALKNHAQQNTGQHSTAWDSAAQQPVGKGLTACPRHPLLCRHE